ncbi:MAG: hypothetical protein AAF384_18180 [Pseudomonadota bacterium]
MPIPAILTIVGVSLLVASPLLKACEKEPLDANEAMSQYVSALQPLNLDCLLRRLDFYSKAATLVAGNDLAKAEIGKAAPGQQRVVAEALTKELENQLKAQFSEHAQQQQLGEGQSCSFEATDVPLPDTVWYQKIAAFTLTCGDLAPTIYLAGRRSNVWRILLEQYRAPAAAAEQPRPVN